MSLYRRAVRPLLFRLDPERAHNGAIALGAALGRTGFGAAAVGRLFRFEDQRLRQQVAGMTFANPVGLAAGFDKSGRAVRGLASIGFGSIEVGSVSARSSRGNAERPRLFRLPADEAIAVYYGVPNDGAEVVARRLARSRVDVPLGVNLVETNTGVPVPAGEVMAELSEAAAAFSGVADYLALNLNCPNTGGGRSPFDDGGMIRELLGLLASIPGLPPVFLKLTASADPGRRDGVLEEIDGFPFVKGIIFNLPPGIPRQGLKTPAAELARMPGTLCGPPVRELVNRAIRAWYPCLDHSRHVIVGSGGISSAEEAYEKIRLGATLLQLYTALVFRGPGIVREINRGLCRLLERDGFSHLGEAVGADHVPGGGRVAGAAAGPGGDPSQTMQAANRGPGG